MVGGLERKCRLETSRSTSSQPFLPFVLIEALVPSLMDLLYPPTFAFSLRLCNVVLILLESSFCLVDLERMLCYQAR